MGYWFALCLCYALCCFGVLGFGLLMLQLYSIPVAFDLVYLVACSDFVMLAIWVVCVCFGLAMLFDDLW